LGLGKSNDYQSGLAGKRKLVDEEEEDEDAEEQTKKGRKQLLTHKMTRGSRWRLVASPAVSNDCTKLELLGAWELWNSSFPSPTGEG
jgi:hypothetical protein